MADSYTQGTISPFLPLTPLQYFLVTVDLDDIGADFAEEPKEEVLEHLKALGAEDPEAAYQFFLDLELHYWDDPDSGISAEKYGDKFYLYCEFGLLNYGEYLLQTILKTLPEDEYPYIVYEYANTCSKMRPGEFGGGAVFITRDDIYYTNTSEWVQEKEREWKSRTSKGT